MTQRQGARVPSTEKDAEMPIDFQRQAERDRESREAQKREAQRVAGLVRTAAIIDQHLELSGTPMTRSASAGGSADQFGAASPLGALVSVGESAEEGIAGAQPSHLDQFPELKDVELHTDTVARFPELEDQPSKAPKEEIEDDGYGRGGW